MESHLVFDTALTPADRVVLSNLAKDIAESKQQKEGATCTGADVATQNTALNLSNSSTTATCLDQKLDVSGHEPKDTCDDITALKAENDPSSPQFEPSVFSSVDLRNLKLPGPVDKYLLRPYISWARKMVRVETDVIMLTHLIIYLSTSIPSAIILFRNFTYTHALLHVVMQFYYTGAYTLMMHQHIHMRGILAKQYSLFDHAFPYILDPLMGHSWNTYFYHHVKHHHVEGNGPDDLSSTMRYQRDEIWDFARYVGRFYFLIWFDLPLYFLRKNRPLMALKAGGSEFLTYVFYYAASRINGKATFFVYLLPLLLLRVGLMVGNWGQHAFVDVDQPDSDFRSSITLIDVAVCYC